MRCQTSCPWDGMAVAEPLWIFQLQLRVLPGTQCPRAYKCVWEPEEDAFKGLLGLVLAGKQESACRSPGPHGSRRWAPRLPSRLLPLLGEPSAVQKASFSSLALEFSLWAWRHDLHCHLYYLILCLPLDELVLCSL